MKTSRDPSRARVAAALLVLPLAACSAPRTTIEGSDDDAVFPSVRGSFELGTRDERPAEEDGERRRVATLEVELAQAEGDFDQTIAGGETIELDDTLFTGPATIAFDVELARAAALARLGLRDDRLDLGISAVISDLALDLDGRSGGVSADEDHETVALALAVDLGWRVLNRLSLYARAGVDTSPDDLTLGQLELGAESRLVRAVALGVGWRKWEIEREEVSESDLDVELSGLVIGLRIVP